MWTKGWRDRVWSELDKQWDIIVIGGGITGAGIMREASRAGLRVLLVEAGDFASGTSSRSSKMVHGGLRYLKNAQIKLTYESIHERERLMREGRGMVAPLKFAIAGFAGDVPPLWVFGLGLMVYDIMAMRWNHNYRDAQKLLEICPQISKENLSGSYFYYDAQTDDARLVLRVIREGVKSGGTALNYACVEGLLLDRGGQVHGIQLRDNAEGRTQEIRAAVVINATGAWSDDLRAHIGQNPRLRKLRGSHLFFPWTKLPLRQAVTFLHPRDRRPVFAFPWEGLTLVGTTDVDHGISLKTDPGINTAEVEYLMDAITYAFKPAGLTLSDVRSSLSGVRAVVDTGKVDPSKESRESVFWNENGLLTVTGGKLTTFRLMAHQALRMVSKHLPGNPRFGTNERVLDPVDPFELPVFSPITQMRLLGRYDGDVEALASAAQPGEFQYIEDTPAVWAELRWAARTEAVVHLDDLLLRRVRLGLMLPEGGSAYLARIRPIVQPELGWSDSRWDEEVTAYIQRWRSAYFLP
jgi:glycerol-3-phosphate dehydrogenase